MNVLSQLAALIEVDVNDALVKVLADPDGDYAKMLAKKLRDHPEGGIEKVIEAIHRLAAVMSGLDYSEAEAKQYNFEPLPDDELRQNIREL